MLAINDSEWFFLNNAIVGLLRDPKASNYLVASRYQVKKLRLTAMSCNSPRFMPQQILPTLK
jgi:hypothetical protein